MADAVLEHFPGGARDAAAFVVEQINAACARRARCDDEHRPQVPSVEAA